MTFGPLVSTDWLASHLDDHDLRVVDCRWFLGEPDRGPAEYARSHIRGAIYMDLENELSAPTGAGRHPLPDAHTFMTTLGAKGINPDTMVVAYDDRSGAVASRLWWMLRDLGHEKVAVLDGGLAHWPVALTDSNVVTPTPTEYRSQPGAMAQIDREALAAGGGNLVLIDARAGERYRGELEPVDPIAGHIPSARSAPLTENLRPDGRFRSREALASQYAALGGPAAADVVAYCGSGVTACHNILAMEFAGIGTATLYAGSWSDWSTAGMPVAIGPDPGKWPV